MVLESRDDHGLLPTKSSEGATPDGTRLMATVKNLNPIHVCSSREDEHRTVPPLQDSLRMIIYAMKSLWRDAHRLPVFQQTRLMLTATLGTLHSN
jgi:hypothetical protein